MIPPQLQRCLGASGGNRYVWILAARHVLPLKADDVVSSPTTTPPSSRRCCCEPQPQPHLSAVLVLLLLFASPSCFGKPRSISARQTELYEVRCQMAEKRHSTRKPLPTINSNTKQATSVLLSSLLSSLTHTHTSFAHSPRCSPLANGLRGCSAKRLCPASSNQSIQTQSVFSKRIMLAFLLTFLFGVVCGGGVRVRVFCLCARSQRNKQTRNNKTTLVQVVENRPFDEVYDIDDDEEIASNLSVSPAQSQEIHSTKPLFEPGNTPPQSPPVSDQSDYDGDVTAAVCPEIMCVCVTRAYTHMHADKCTHRHTDRQTTNARTQTCMHAHTHTQRQRQTDKQTNRQTNAHTDRQTDRHTHTHTLGWLPGHGQRPWTDGRARHCHGGRQCVAVRRQSEQLGA